MRANKVLAISPLTRRSLQECPQVKVRRLQSPFYSEVSLYGREQKRLKVRHGLHGMFTVIRVTCGLQLMVVTNVYLVGPTG